MQVWRTASSYDASRGTVSSWLATLARSRSVDWLRSPHARFSRQCHALEDSPEAGDFSANPEHASLQAGRDRIIRKSMGQLPPEQRQAIELAYFSGFSHSEIAGRLGVPLGTVKARIRLGMSHLRQSLVPYVEAGL